MAVITGYYESHVSVALLNVNPMLTTGDTETFMTTIKKKNNPKRREEV